MGWLGTVQHSENGRTPAEAVSVYTSQSDFCRVFKEEMRGLYLLSLFLTADSEEAERCFVAGLDDCIKGNPVFRGWAYAWSRRAIIMNAIRIVFSRPANTKASTPTTHPEWKFVAESPLASVTLLEPFERFVFVMTLLEGYSDHECSVFLNRSRSDVVAARTRALQQLKVAEWQAQW